MKAAPETAPPRFAARALAVFLRPERRDELLGDLDEEFALLASMSGRKAARRWYAAQLLGSVLPVLCGWCRFRTVAAARTLRAPTIGTGFIALAVLWWIAVATMVPLDTPAPTARDAQNSSHADLVTVQDGSARLVYWVLEPVRVDGDGMPGPMRLAIIALAPPGAVALATLLGLILAEGWSARRRVSPVPAGPVSSSWRS